MSALPPAVDQFFHATTDRIMDAVVAERRLRRGPFAVVAFDLTDPNAFAVALEFVESHQTTVLHGLDAAPMPKAQAIEIISELHEVGEAHLMTIPAPIAEGDLRGALTRAGAVRARAGGGWVALVSGHALPRLRGGLSMLMLHMPKTFKVGDTEPCRINKQPTTVHWRPDHHLVLGGHRCPDDSPDPAGWGPRAVHLRRRARRARRESDRGPSGGGRLSHSPEAVNP